ncbi:hypothetical protein AURDEDRAFT_163330 [Auricularia subglabra TFB-10046 SS5]|nr:hypothetical protein AURDEDRAFT_163330 [Auricularia subglabra TFB-10046 SS5]
MAKVFNRFSLVPCTRLRYGLKFNPAEWIGKDIFAVAEHSTRDLAAIQSKEVKQKQITPEEFFQLAHVPNPVVVELFLNMKFFHEYQPQNSGDDEAASKMIFPGQDTLENFVQYNQKFKKFAAYSVHASNEPDGYNDPSRLSLPSFLPSPRRFYM